MEFESKSHATKWTLDIGFTESTGKRIQINQNQHQFLIKVKCELDRITVQNNCTDRINVMAVHSKQNIEDIQKAIYHDFGNRKDQRERRRLRSIHT